MGHGPLHFGIPDVRAFQDSTVSRSVLPCTLCAFSIATTTKTQFSPRRMANIYIYMYREGSCSPAWIHAHRTKSRNRKKRRCGYRKTTTRRQKHCIHVSTAVYSAERQIHTERISENTWDRCYRLMGQVNMSSVIGHPNVLLDSSPKPNSHRIRKAKRNALIFRKKKKYKSIDIGE